MADFSCPVESKSLLAAGRTPSTATSCAPKSSSPSFRSRTSTFQKPADRNAIRRRSRSTSNRTATLCTRPADRPLRTFRHSTGDRP